MKCRHRNGQLLGRRPAAPAALREVSQYYLRCSRPLRKTAATPGWPDSVRPSGS